MLPCEAHDCVKPRDNYCSNKSGESQSKWTINPFFFSPGGLRQRLCVSLLHLWRVQGRCRLVWPLTEPMCLVVCPLNTLKTQQFNALSPFGALQGNTEQRSTAYIYMIEIHFIVVKRHFKLLVLCKVNLLTCKWFSILLINCMLKYSSNIHSNPLEVLSKGPQISSHSSAGHSVD